MTRLADNTAVVTQIVVMPIALAAAAISAVGMLATAFGAIVAAFFAPWPLAIMLAATSPLMAGVAVIGWEASGEGSWRKLVVASAPLALSASACLSFARRSDRAHSMRTTTQPRATPTTNTPFPGSSRKTLPQWQRSGNSDMALA